MTRAKISEYSATANDNTDVNGINIAEGCPPSSMNNMGREIMAALKRFQVGSDGDGVTVGGSLVVSGSTSVNTFNVDVISEKTSAAGVTIDSVLLKDGGVTVSDGTVSAPTVTNTGDTNTGVYFPAADEVAISAGGSVAGAFNSHQFMGMRNRIINGDMRIDQRNAGASITPTDGQYSLDRWRCEVAQSSKMSVQQNAGSVTPPAGFKNYLGVTSLSAYAVLTNDYFSVGQLIEGFNVADLGWGAAGAKTVTISFWVRSSLTGTFGGGLINSGNNRSYPFTYTISVADTWEYKTVTIAGDTSGTWLSTNGTGVQVLFSMGAGSGKSNTAGAWVGSYASSATGAVSVVGTNAATWYITGVQLEVGSVATPFERRPYGTELSLCQRYFEKSYSTGTAPGSATNLGIFKSGANVYSGSSFPGSIIFRVEKRAAPTMTFWSDTSPGSVQGQWTFYNPPSTNAGVNVSSIDVSTTVSNLTASTSSYAFCQGHWVASSEL